jgi:hypothetical protein
MSGVPHKSQGIKLAVERPMVIDPTGAASGLKCGAVKPFSPLIMDESHLAALGVGKDRGRQALFDRQGNLLAGEIRPKDAVGVRKSTAHLTTETCTARNELRKDFWCSHEEFRRDATF